MGIVATCGRTALRNRPHLVTFSIEALSFSLTLDQPSIWSTSNIHSESVCISSDLEGVRLTLKVLQCTWKKTTSSILEIGARIPSNGPGGAD